ncbi:amidase domain-containing protein [Methyloglobulus sp.]|uniref:amidase domain-containing protein n=1 Tax=Methyloglobulus sp. TaxID=2518622 RepID=UPI0032B731D2
MLKTSTSLILILFGLIANAETYSPSYSVTYAINNYAKAYGSGSNRNPFPNLAGTTITGGNCTNFVNQSISGGLLSSTNSYTLNNLLTRGKFPSTVNPSWFYKCNSVSNLCQPPTWRGAQNMFAFSRDKANAKALRMAFITKTALVNNKLQPLDHTKIRKGDIIFADWSYVVGSSVNSVDHSMVVTGQSADHWYDITRTMKYNNIRLTYQTTNRTDVGLGSIWVDGKTAFYVYRPTGYFR